MIQLHTLRAKLNKYLDPYFEFRLMYEQQNTRAMFAGTVLRVCSVQRFVIVIHSHMQFTTIISLESINEPDHKEKTNKSLSCMTEKPDRPKKTYFTSLTLQHHKQTSQKIMCLRFKMGKRKKEKGKTLGDPGLRKAQLQLSQLKKNWTWPQTEQSSEIDIKYSFFF